MNNSLLILTIAGAILTANDLHGYEATDQRLWDHTNGTCGSVPRESTTITEMDDWTLACWNGGYRGCVDPVTGWNLWGDIEIRSTEGPELEAGGNSYRYKQELWCISTNSFKVNITWRRPACIDSDELGVDQLAGEDGVCLNRSEEERRERLINTQCPLDGNPCNSATGDKLIQETDFEGSGLHFYRTWHSLAPKESSPIGSRWVHSYGDYIDIDGTGTPIGVVTPDGYYMTLTAVPGNIFIAPEQTSIRLRIVGPNYVIEYGNGERRTYDSNGRLQTVEVSPGQVTTLTYGGSPSRLQEITGPFGHTLSLSYNVSDKLQDLYWPDNNRVTYSHTFSNGNWRLVKVRRVGFSRYYLYEDTLLPDFITGIEDENGDRHATYTYDHTTRKVLSSQHAGGARRVELSYASDSTTVTDGDGRTKTYDFSLSPWKGTRLDGTTRNGTSTSMVHALPATDYLQRLATKTDASGQVTAYGYNAYHRTSTTAAFGTPDQRTTSYEFLRPDSNLVTKIIRPSIHGTGNAVTEITYNSSDLPTQITESGFDSSGSAITRTTGLTYNTYGQVLTIDGPRTDVSDVTSFTYHNCTAGGACGQLHTVTNPAGHVHTYNSYNSNGRLTKETTATGYETTYVYSSVDWLSSITIRSPYGSSRYHSISYARPGLLARAPLAPYYEELRYSYDEAHRLVKVRDSSGNHIDYVYDSAGNRTEIRTEDSSDVMSRKVEYAYDNWSRLDTINNAGNVTDVLLDAIGRLVEHEDANLDLTGYVYDNLNRLTAVNHPDSSSTSFAYDVNDNMVSVTAPNGANTTYVYDDLGNLESETSPDRGTISYTYDAAGNVLTKTDARGVLATYTYDALNRLTSTSYPTSSKNVTFAYDSGPNNQGYLTSMTDESGTTTWNHYVHGPASSEKRIETTRTVAGQTFTTSLKVHAVTGKPISLTYPSGKVLSYTFSGYELTGLSAAGTTILSGATYEPLGPVNGWTWGDATVSNWVFDLRGLPANHSLAGDTRTLGYDNVGQIITLDDSRHDLGFDYDTRGRLTDFDALGLAPLTSQDFGYDTNGNRLSFTEGMSYPYTIAPNSNRVATVAGPIPRTYSYDAAGNIINDGSMAYTYDDRGRLVTAGTATYTYNGLGQRVKKDNGTVTLFVYDEAGNLLGEYDAAGNPIREHVWFQGAPVAVMAGSDVHYVHTDHLGTPRAITDAGTVIWRWESDPFGSTAAQEDPDGDLTDFTYNLRFPGQYYDSESGLHYNYFRTYDPSTGRYFESDPIGLGGGINTYGYVGGNPMAFSDPLGLSRQDPRSSVVQFCLQHPAECPEIIPMGIASAVVLGKSVSSLTESIAAQLDLNNCEGDPCEVLEAEIMRTMTELAGRRTELLEDPYRLYSLARSAPNPDLTRVGSYWDGHVEAYESLRTRLGNLMYAANELGCKIPPGAMSALTLSAPKRPSRYGF